MTDVIVFDFVAGEVNVRSADGSTRPVPADLHFDSVAVPASRHAG